MLCIHVFHKAANLSAGGVGGRRKAGKRCERMGQRVIALVDHRHAVFLEPLGIIIALIDQRVMSGGDHKRGRQIRQITLHRRNDGFELNALLAKNQLPSNTTLNIGLAVVIENTDGSKNYWALQHCAKQPDFHLRQSFALTLHTTPP